MRAVGGAQIAACHFSEELPAAGRRAMFPATAVFPEATVVRPALLQVSDLKVHFPIRSGLLRRVQRTVRAVDGVSLRVALGETLGLVGESGCGKTTTGRAIMGLVGATGGSICFDGREIRGLARREMRGVRRQMQYVFQDPYASLNPMLSVGEAVAEPLRIHGLYDEMGGERWIAQLFDMVGLSPSVAHRFPREFSGGQKQRIGIARALSLKPKLLILDEPVASLDVSIQAQIVNLLQDLQRDLALAYLFIAHDLSVVKHISDRVAVMYLGQIVEEGTKADLYRGPGSPLYTGAPVRGSRDRRGDDGAQRANRAAGRDSEPCRAPERVPFPSALFSRDGQVPGGAARVRCQFLAARAEAACHSPGAAS